MKIVFATNNAYKLKEFQSILTGNNFEIELIPQSIFSVPEAEETGLTYVENTILKARNACRYTDLPVIADDSGLAVDALQGRPGIYSNRFAGDNATAADKISKLLSLMKEVETARRTARFFCCMVYMRSAEDQMPLISNGTLEGSILHEPVGEGMGYNPVFYVTEKKRVMTELTEMERSQISHRAKAFKKLFALLGD